MKRYTMIDRYPYTAPAEIDWHRVIMVVLLFAWGFAAAVMS